MPSRRAVVKAFLSVQRSCNSSKSLRAANRAASSTVHSRRGAAGRAEERGHCRASNDRESLPLPHWGAR
eukprot:3486277-Prymnesium_polylepis.1